MRDNLNSSDDLASDYYDVATLYSLMADRDKAIDYLEKAFEAGCTYFGLIHWDDQLDNIRDTREFKALVDKYEKKYKERLSLLPKIE